MRKLPTYTLAYLLWAVSVVIGAWMTFRIRDALLALLVVASLDRYESGAREKFYTALQFRATETWSYLFVGLLLIVLIVILEHVFRVGAQAGQVWQRFSLVLAIELGVLALAELALALSVAAVQPLVWSDLIIPLAYLVPAVLFAWLWASLRPKISTA